MHIQISHRGVDLTDDLKTSVEALAARIESRTDGLELAKFVIEEREIVKAVGVVLSWGEKRETVVRHAEGGDWDRAIKDLDRRLERALEEATADDT